MAKARRSNSIDEVQCSVITNIGTAKIILKTQLHHLFVDWSERQRKKTD